MKAQAIIHILEKVNNLFPNLEIIGITLNNASISIHILPSSASDLARESYQYDITERYESEYPYKLSFPFKPCGFTIFTLLTEAEYQTTWSHAWLS
jgi:hypothetical protein